jgi:hypothetical protein
MYPVGPMKPSGVSIIPNWVQTASNQQVVAGDLCELRITALDVRNRMVEVAMELRPAVFR